MHTIIDLKSELLVDRSRIRSPHLRLLLTALGQELTQGSPWIALDKQIASMNGILVQLIVNYADPRVSASSAQIS